MPARSVIDCVSPIWIRVSLQAAGGGAAQHRKARGGKLYERGAEGHEVTGHVSGEKTLERKTSGGVDVAGVETQKERKCRAGFKSAHRRILARSPTESKLHAEVICIPAAGSSDHIAYLILIALERGCPVRADRPLRSQLLIHSGPASG
jgi:hypothetical protein